MVVVPRREAACGGDVEVEVEVDEDERVDTEDAVEAAGEGIASIVCPLVLGGRGSGCVERGTGTVPRRGEREMLRRRP